MLGDQIKTLRKSRHMSQQQLGEKLNVTKQTISNWEKNNVMPTVELVRKMAMIFSCTSDYLLELDSNRMFVETSKLTLEHTALIQQLIDALEAGQLPSSSVLKGDKSEESEKLQIIP